MGNSNIQRLGEVMSNRMKQTSRAAVPTTIELGTVQHNLAIKPDSLQASIPKGDYMVNLMLSGGLDISGGSHSHSGSDHGHTGGAHRHVLPGLKPGDRVLIAWCGNEPVVIAVLDASATLTYTEGNSPSQGGSGDSGSNDTGSGGSGSSGAGGTGGAGNDGFSPTVVVTPITGGNRVTITGANGEKTFDVMDGKTPTKGVDYFTKEEVESIVQEVVNRVTAQFEEKFYTKNQIDTKFDENIITGEEIRSLITEVFGDK